MMTRSKLLLNHFKRSGVPLLTVVGLALVAGGPFGGRTVGAQGRQDLEANHQRMLSVFELAGVVFTDADENSGRLVIGVMDRDIDGLIRARLRVLGVPTESVDIIAAEPIVPVVTLRDQARPVVAGVQIRFSSYLCSLGFNAIRDGITGFVTASHCSDRQGSVDGTTYYQPLNQVPGELIGTEIADPAYRRNSGGCPRGRVCRYSDSNFSDGAGSVVFDLGAIAKTTGPNNGSVTVSGTFAITGPWEKGWL